MSHRPRLAGDGRLLVPTKVSYDRDGFLRGRLAERPIDPFDWTADRLLLAESFARLDLSDRAGAKRWFPRHGMVDRADFVGPDAGLPEDDWLVVRGNDLADHRTDIEIEQANVVWHLLALAHLSDHRSDREWSPEWGGLVISGPEDDLFVGGADPDPTATKVAILDAPNTGSDAYLTLLREVRQRARSRAGAADWPLVTVGEIAWWAYWSQPGVGPAGLVLPEDPEAKAKVLGTTWEGAIALERLLIAPYVAKAVERRFSIEFESIELDGGARSVLVPHEERVWQSILAPIYLQLFEALRRITHGEPGAAICHECGRPFLVLDARRRFFCNGRERFRHGQRERRKRIAAQDSSTALDPSTQHVGRRAKPR